MSDIQIGSKVRVLDNTHHVWVQGHVQKTTKGQVKVLMTDGRSVWIDTSEVKDRLHVLGDPAMEDSSSSDSENERERLMEAQKNARINYGGDQSYRNRSKSTMVATHNGNDLDEDVYQQLRDEWQVHSIVETWSDTGQKWVISQIAHIEKLDEFPEETVLVLYRIENEDGSITTISKRVLISSPTLRPFVNRLHDNNSMRREIEEQNLFLREKNEELTITNDEFLLTIDHQAQTMEQIQSICESVQIEKDELDEECAELYAQIEEKNMVIARLRELLEGNDDYSSDGSADE